MSSKILILDIETAPNIAFVWGAWKQNIGHNQWIEKSSIMSYAAKWFRKDDGVYADLPSVNWDEDQLVDNMLMLLDEADIVVTHNGKKFDIPMILGRAVARGFKPPSPFHQVDTYQVAKNEFKFVSNSLKVVADVLGVAPKDDHKKFPGFELWVECLKNNEEAWLEMRTYNIQDVVTLEQVYEKFLPYIRNHPNVNHDEELKCPKCGGVHIERRGYYTTAAGLVYQRYHCLDCGGWGRSRLIDKDAPKTPLRNAR